MIFSPGNTTGNTIHPTEKAVSILSPLVETFSALGNEVLNPFSGSGSTLVAAALNKRQYLGIELEPHYCKLAEKSLAGVARHMTRGP